MNSLELSEKLRELGDASKYREQGELFLTETGTTLDVVEAVPQRLAPWTEDHLLGTGVHPIHYVCTLKNSRGSYTFDYWGSINDATMVKRAEDLMNSGSIESPEFFIVSDFLKKETGKPLQRVDVWRGNFARTGADSIPARVREAVKPRAYDVLTALHPMSADTFEEFCGEYGYDSDSIKAEKTFRACVEQDRMMRKLYTRQELEALQEIA